MKRILISISLLCSWILIGCANLTSLTFSTATATITPTLVSTPTQTTIPTLTIRPVITIEPYSKYFPLEEPITPLSDEQISQVKECDIENFAADRYPEDKKADELIYLFAPETSCDWAVLSYAYAVRLKDNEEMPDIAKNAFSKAIADNPGFALSTPLFYRYYYDSFTIVKQPKILDQEITDVTIFYRWGDEIEYKVDISQAVTNPSVAVSNYKPVTVNQNINTKIEKDTVQALGKSLSNLLPINSQFSLITCTDNSPDWTTTIRLKDGTLIDLKTNGSNMIHIGGPWQTNIDGQNYLQYSTEFIKAIDALIREIGLPYGQPMGMTCGPMSVIKQAYPSPPVTFDEIQSWKKYVHTESGMSFEYPENCIVSEVGSSVHFWCDDMDLYGLLDIEKLTPEETEMIMNPPVFKEDDGFIILWQRPIESPDLSGWEYIISHFPEPIVTPSPGADLSKYFHITFIDKTKQIRFNFFTSFDYKSLQLAKELGFDEVVSSRYSVFEYMARSLSYEK